MTARTLFRITAIVFLLFAAGHTFGFLSFKAPTQEGIAVFESMNTVHFEVGHKIFSYGGWYRGFGLTATFSMLFEAFFAWYLGSMATSAPRETRVLGWAFFAWQIPGAGLSWIYFGLIPMIFSVAAAVLLAAAAWLVPEQP